MPAATAARDVPTPAPMRLLEDGIPLSLLLDLVLGPHSEELLVRERPDAAVPAQQA